MRTYFFIGKGGVGKTTVASSFAIGKSFKKNKTLIVSLDPAHNLGDALNKNVFGHITRVTDYLDAIEVDIDEMINNYLKEMSEKMKNTYRYLTVLNIDRYFDILRNSPGIEEYATLEAIKRFLNVSYDAVVFDTPPTGITLRVFSMPRISIIWTNSLIDMRRRILSRRKMVENVKGPIEEEIDGEKVRVPTDESEDPVMRELFAYKSDMQALMSWFSSEENSVNIVTMAETLAFAESKRIMEALRINNMKLRRIYLNKYLVFENVPEELAGKVEEQKSVVEEMKGAFRDIEIKKIPFVKVSPQGVDALYSLYKDYVG